MMVPMILGVVAFFSVGAALYSRQRSNLSAAMPLDGFKDHEVRKAMRLHARGRQAELIEYCREVVERNARPTARDWTKAESYRETV